MKVRTYINLYGLVIASTVSSAKMCSPETCIKGNSESPPHDPNSVDLIPGTYQLSSYRSSDLELRNTNLSTDSKSFTISLPSSPVVFSKKAYHDLIPTGEGDWSSIYLPDGWYGTLAAGQAIWGAVPDKGQLRNGPPRTRGFVEIAYDRCDPACGYGGTCQQGNMTATCQCRPGWGGQTCDQCASGHFGADCQPCSGDCTQCDDGLAGTGTCLGTKTDSLKQCDCLHGSCNSANECTCAAGWITNSSASSKCNTCAPGFFQTKSSDCQACPFGCSDCTLQEGTNSTPSCTACSSTLTLSTSNPVTCVSLQSCPTGRFWNPNSSSCDSCSPACATCTGSSPSQCLSCAAPRVNLAGSCVGYATSSGVCDSSLSGLSAVFVVNNEKSKCDACPVGCTSCSIPSYSPSSAYSTLTCSACQDGYLLQTGQCVKTCSEGFFLPPNSAERNGTCQRCDDSCLSCIGSSTTCTRCPDGLFASNGQCTPACPYRTSGLNSTCLPCSPTCGTCTSPLDSKACTSCPPDRPVLHNNQCSTHCPKAMFFDGTTCQRCDPQCTSCIGSSSSCSSCPDGHILQAGKCKEVDCVFAVGMGVCLSDLVTPGKRWLPAIILPILLLLVGAVGLWWYRRKQQRRRKAEVKQFGDAMDQVKARDGDSVPMRLERILGLNRVRVQSEEEEGRYRLREFLLPQSNKGKGKEKATTTTTTTNNRRPTSTLSTLNTNDPSSSSSKSDQLNIETDKKIIPKRNTSRWSNPPPPYTRPPPTRDSVSTIGTLDLSLPKRGEIRLLSPSKITSMSQSPIASLFPILSFTQSALAPSSSGFDLASGSASGSGSESGLGQGQGQGQGLGLLPPGVNGLGTGLKPPPRYKVPADEYNQKPTLRYSGAGTGTGPSTGTGTGTGTETSGTGGMGNGQLDELWPARKIEGWI